MIKVNDALFEKYKHMCGTGNWLASGVLRYQHNRPLPSLIGTVGTCIVYLGADGGDIDTALVYVEATKPKTFGDLIHENTNSVSGRTSA